MQQPPSGALPAVLAERDRAGELLTGSENSSEVTHITSTHISSAQVRLVTTPNFGELGKSGPPEHPQGELGASFILMRISSIPDH